MNYVPSPVAQLPESVRALWTETMSPQDLETALAAFASGFSPAFRVNPAKGSAARAEGSLQDSGIAVSRAELPLSYRTDREGEYKLRSHPLAEEGGVYLQSVPSQIPPHALLALSSNSQYLLDTCAAPGGKATLLAALFPHAEVVALERDKIRFQKLEFTVKRQGASNVRAFAMDALSPAKWMQGRSFDAVLVDAPCSGSGTANARNPKHLEVLAQDYDGYVVSRAAIQSKLLDAAFGYVREGGLVVYSTCSVDPRENESVVADALAKPGREAVGFPSELRAVIAGARPGLATFRGRDYPASLAGALRLFPSDKGEGFFCAVMRKVAAA